MLLLSSADFFSPKFNYRLRSTCSVISSERHGLVAMTVIEAFPVRFTCALSMLGNFSFFLLSSADFFQN